MGTAPWVRGSIDSAGELSFPYAGLSADTHTITLEVLDEVGEYLLEHHHSGKWLGARDFLMLL